MAGDKGPDSEVHQAVADLVGTRVSVRSNTGSDDCEDVGTLEAVDGAWVRLRKERGEVLCFPLYNVRLVKALEPIPAAVPAARLLRPFSGPDGEGGQEAPSLPTRPGSTAR